PAAVNDASTTLEDNAVTINVLANDTDVDSPLLGTDGRGPQLVSGPAHGVLILNGNGTFTYTPVLNFNGFDSFTYKVLSGTWSGPPSQKMSADSNTATVAITIYPVNDAPTASGQSVTTSEDTPKAIVLTASDVETNSANLTASITGPAHGTVTGTWPNYTYKPAKDYNGSDGFTFTVTDRGDP